ncbi:MAG: hypothetical protein EZS28_048446, partial [Streblomastix strix]
RRVWKHAVRVPICIENVAFHLNLLAIEAPIFTSPQAARRTAISTDVPLAQSYLASPHAMQGIQTNSILESSLSPGLNAALFLLDRATFPSDIINYADQMVSQAEKIDKLAEKLESTGKKQLTLSQINLRIQTGAAAQSVKFEERERANQLRSSASIIYTRVIPLLSDRILVDTFDRKFFATVADWVEADGGADSVNNWDKWEDCMNIDAAEMMRIEGTLLLSQSFGAGNSQQFQAGIKSRNETGTAKGSQLTGFGETQNENQIENMQEGGIRQVTLNENMQRMRLMKSQIILSFHTLRLLTTIAAQGALSMSNRQIEHPFRVIFAHRGLEELFLQRIQILEGMGIIGGSQSGEDGEDNEEDSNPIRGNGLQVAMTFHMALFLLLISRRKEED